MKSVKVNTGNIGKREEFKKAFSSYGYDVSFTSVDIDEPQASHTIIANYKACQTVNDKYSDESGSIVEDTALHIEGADVGVNVKHMLDELPKYIGRKARFVADLAQYRDRKVYHYIGEVSGTIVEARGTKGHGFDKVFRPDGSHKTLSELDEIDLKYLFNARNKAVDKYVVQEPSEIDDVCFFLWAGKYQ